MAMTCMSYLLIHWSKYKKSFTHSKLFISLFLQDKIVQKKTVTVSKKTLKNWKTSFKILRRQIMKKKYHECQYCIQLKKYMVRGRDLK